VNYLAQEYFSRDWNPNYHAEVVRNLSGAKLVYAGSANLADQIDVVNLSPSMRAIIAGISDPVLKETVCDFSLNQ